MLRLERWMVLVDVVGGWRVVGFWDVGVKEAGCWGDGCFCLLHVPCIVGVE